MKSVTSVLEGEEYKVTEKIFFDHTFQLKFGHLTYTLGRSSPSFVSVFFIVSLIHNLRPSPEKENEKTKNVGELKLVFNK